MKLRGFIALLAFSFGLLFSVAQGQGSGSEAVDLEWRIRALALASSRIELSEPNSWEERCVLLEALRRRLELGLEAGLAEGDSGQLTEWLEDDAPNVRAAALACLEAAGLEVWDPETISRLASDPFPEVRALLCRAVPSRLWRQQLPILEQLARSDDAAVRRAGRLALLRLETTVEEVASVQAALLDHILRTEGSRAYLFELERLSRLPKTQFPVHDAALTLNRLDSSGEALRAARALWFAVSSELEEASDAKVVAAGWGCPLDPSWSSPHRVQRKLMLQAARKAGEVLALELIAAVARALQLEPSIERELRLEHLFEGLLEAEGTRWILARLEGLELSEGDWLTFWSVADSGEARFDAALLRSWLKRDYSVELRELMADVLVAEFVQTESAEALSGVLELLLDEHPEVLQIAIQALSAAPFEIVESVDFEFHAAWKRLSRKDRLAFLRRLPRSGRLVAFRSSLLELGREVDLRRAHPSILELLGKFEADEECGRLLSEWLVEDAAFISENPSAPEFREVEIAVRGGVRALHSVGGERAVSRLEAILALTSPVSVEIAKTCAWCLGQTQAGLPALEGYLQAGVSTRVQVEAALALARRGADSVQDRANSVLVDRYDSCDDELRGRILGVFASTGAEVGRALAHSLFTAQAAFDGEAVQALEVLQSWFERDPSEANFAWFVDYVETAPSQEARRLVIEALGERRDPRSQALLEERLLLGVEALGAERQELLVALARVSPASSLLWNELWRVPFGAAQVRLEERFRGKIPAAVRFSYRGELEALAEISSADTWPERASVELVRLDGQLASALAEACRGAGDSPHATRLDRIALVALAGELSNEKARLTGLRVRTRLWKSAEAEGRNSEAAHLAQRLHEDWVSGELSGRDVETLMGPHDPGIGRDPVSRLASSVLQARARVAASEGDGEGARRLAAEARAKLGFSEAARRQQAALESDLR